MEWVDCPLCRGGRHRELLMVGPRRIVRCESCGVVFRTPRPSVSAYVDEFGSGRAEAADEAWLGTRRSTTFTRFLDAWPDRPGRVLDVGCGGGWFLKAAVERGWDAVGVDLSPKAVRHAREVFGVDARQGTLEAQRFAPGSFDLVTLWNILEVIPDPLALLRAVRPLLRPGGTLSLRTQNYPFHRVAFAASRAARVLGLGAWLDQRPHVAFIFNVTAFSARTIRLFLDRAGFTAVRVMPSRPSPGDPYRALDGREWPLVAVKTVADLVARSVYAASGGRWIAAASLEASARCP
jgi:2-polyprenyl-3-methyl-5-hydroxy-6-metoxy-1,4-benzoquinol methylase